jgi:hypothetical protein
LFGDEAEARTKYDEVIRAEWDSIMDPNDDGPYPSDPMKPKTGFAKLMAPNRAAGS